MVPFAIPIFSVLSSKSISVHNEEILVAVCSVGFVPSSQKTLGDTIRATSEARAGGIQTDLQHTPGSQEALWSEFKEQHESLLLSLRSGTQMIGESCPNETAERSPLCKQTVQAVPCQQIEIQLEALNAIREHSRRGFQGKIVSCSRKSVGDECRRQVSQLSADFPL